MAEIEEKAFHYFLEFSQKVRMMVTNEMEPADRCRLTRCSKLCDKEVKTSKKFVYEMELVYNPNGTSTIQVSHGTHEPIHNTGYILTFNSATKLKRYMNRSYQTLWETALDIRMDVAQLALEELKSVIQNYQKSVRKLRICIYSPEESVEKIEMVDFGIENLDSLEHLFVTTGVDIKILLSKIRKPLKTLYIQRYANSGITDYKPIYQIQEDLTWFGEKFDNQQFLQISAKSVAISIGKLTERDIFHFIRSWQNGTIGKDIGDYFWSLDDSEFNKQNLLKLLRIRDYNEREPLEIKHFEEAGEIARLYISERSISFVVPNNAW